MFWASVIGQRVLVGGTGNRTHTGRQVHPMGRVSRQVPLVRVVSSLLRGQAGCGGNIGAQGHAEQDGGVENIYGPFFHQQEHLAKRTEGDDLMAVPPAHLRGIDSVLAERCMVRATLWNSIESECSGNSWEYYLFGSTTTFRAGWKHLCPSKSRASTAAARCSGPSTC